MLVTQLCPTLCNPVDYSPPGSSVHEILQARILEWIAIPFLGDLPNPGMETGSPALQADTLSSEPSNYGAFWLILKSHPHHVDLNVSIGLSQLKLI